MKKNKSAFTLIELLVTIVLFSLLLATALYSFRFISINIRHINNTNPQRAMNFNFLKDVFSSTYYYIDTDEKAQKARNRFYHYFEGSKSSCRFISNASIFYDELVVIQVSVKNNSLLYEEGRIFAQNINYKEINSIKLTQKIKILENIEALTFSYEKKGRKNMVISKKIPDNIQIDFQKNKKSYSYIFSIKSKNMLKLETLIRDYELINSLQGGI